MLPSCASENAGAAGSSRTDGERASGTSCGHHRMLDDSAADRFHDATSASEQPASGACDGSRCASTGNHAQGSRPETLHDAKEAGVS
jgi:hypothetical protein